MCVNDRVFRIYSYVRCNKIFCLHNDYEKFVHYHCLFYNVPWWLRCKVKVQEAKHEEKESNDQLRSLKDKMIALVLGENDMDVIEWKDSMALTTKNKQQQR